MLKRLLGNSFLRGSIIFTSASFVVSLVNYFFNLLVAKNFSLSLYGEYASALSYFVVLTVPFQALSVVVISRIGRSRVGDRVLVARAIEQWLIKQIKEKYALVALIGVLFSSLMIFKANVLPETTLFVLALSFLQLFISFYAAVLQAYKAFMISSFFVLAFALLKILGVGVVLLTAPVLWALYSVIILSGIMTVFLGYRLLRGKNKFEQSSPLSVKKTKQLPAFHFQKLTTYLRRKKILIALLTTLGIMGMANVDIILVKKFMPSEEAGLYAALSLLGKIILYAAAPLSLVAYTFFTGSDTKDQTPRVLFFTTIALFVVSLVSIFFYATFPEFIIGLVFDERYLVVAPLVWLAGLFGALYSLATLYSQYWIAKEKMIGALSLVALVLEGLLILFFHNSLREVLFVSIFVNGGLVSFYTLALFKERYLSVTS